MDRSLINCPSDLYPDVLGQEGLIIGNSMENFK